MTHGGPGHNSDSNVRCISLACFLMTMNLFLPPRAPSTERTALEQHHLFLACTSPETYPKRNHKSLQVLKYLRKGQTLAYHEPEIHVIQRKDVLRLEHTFPVEILKTCPGSHFMAHSEDGWNESHNMNPWTSFPHHKRRTYFFCFNPSQLSAVESMGGKWPVLGEHVEVSMSPFAR